MKQTNSPEHICLTPGCLKFVSEKWEETGRYCPDCAIQIELLDREGRRTRLIAVTRPRVYAALQAFA